ncbi:MAG TPA: sugar ABC transporter permease [Ruminiclostridium sp.]
MKKRNQNIFIVITTVPALIFYVAIFLYPIFRAVTMSFYRWSGLTSGTEKFIGLNNFKKLLQDDRFWLTVKNSAVLMICVPVGVVVLALLFAAMLTRRKLAENNLYRTIFFLPNVLSVVVIAMLWQLIYHPTLGILNTLLEKVGLESIARVWLGDAGTALLCVAATMIWTSIGYYLVLFMAGIEGIPEQLYEAAVIDGAGEVAQFFNITLPLLWEILRVAFILLISNAFYGALVFVQVMTNGGPDNASLTMPNYMYNMAFQNSNMGYATAVGVAIFIVGISLSLITDRISKKETVEFQ